MRRLTFIDLDLTLFDYTRARKNASNAALQCLNLQNIPETIKIMESVLAFHGDLIAELGLPNFRREWKARELFATAILLTQEASFQRSRRSFMNLLTLTADFKSVCDGFDSPFWARWKIRRYLIEKSSLLGYNNLSRKVEDILQQDRWTSRIQDAVNVFEEYFRSHTWEMEGAGVMLGALRNQGSEVYVVSEGDGAIQKEKLSMLDIGPLVDDSFVTGDCCRSEFLLNELWTTALSIEKEKGIISTENDQVWAFSALYDEIVPYSSKTQTFFRKVMQTVLLPPKHRRVFYDHFQWLDRKEIERAGPVGLLVIGDRYEKDILPAIEAFGEIRSIRFLFGKYKRTFTPHELAEMKFPEPDCYARTMKQIARSISSNGYDILPLGTNSIDALDLPMHRQARIEHALEILNKSELRQLKNLLPELELLAGGSREKKKGHRHG